MDKSRFVTGAVICITGTIGIELMVGVVASGLTPRASLWLTLLLCASFGYLVVGPLLQVIMDRRKKKS